MRKKLMAILIAITLIIASTTTAFATTATVELRPNSTTVNAGDTFTVTLHLTTDQPFETIGGDQNSGRDNDSFALNYDASKLELINQEVVTTNVMDMGIDVNENTGEEERVTDKVLLMANSGIRTGDLYKWTFRVKSDVESDNIQISTTSIIGTDSSDEEITMQTNPITITVESNTTGSIQEGNDDGATGEQEPENEKEEGTTGQGSNNSKQPTIKESGNDGSKKENTTEQSGDNTTAASAGKIIPPAGLNVIKTVIMAGITTIGIIAYKRFNQLRDVK